MAVLVQLFHLGCGVARIADPVAGIAAGQDPDRLVRAVGRLIALGLDRLVAGLAAVADCVGERGGSVLRPGGPGGQQPEQEQRQAPQIATRIIEISAGVTLPVIGSPRERWNSAIAVEVAGPFTPSMAPL